MSLLPECPRCFGMMTGNIKTKLSSACRCGFQTSATWADEGDPSALETLADEALAELRLTEVVHGDPFLRMVAGDAVPARAFAATQSRRVSPSRPSGLPSTIAREKRA